MPVCECVETTTTSRSPCWSAGRPTRSTASNARYTQSRLSANTVAARSSATVSSPTVSSFAARIVGRRRTSAAFAIASTDRCTQKLTPSTAVRCVRASRPGSAFGGYPR